MHFRRRYCLPRPQLRAWSSSIRQVDQSSSSRVTLSQGQSSVNFLSSSPSSHSPPLLPKLSRSNIWLLIAHQYPKYRDTQCTFCPYVHSLYSLGWSTFLVVHIHTRCNCLTRRHGVIGRGLMDKWDQRTREAASSDAITRTKWSRFYRMLMSARFQIAIESTRNGAFAIRLQLAIFIH